MLAIFSFWNLLLILSVEKDNTFYFEFSAQILLLSQERDQPIMVTENDGISVCN